MRFIRLSLSVVALQAQAKEEVLRLETLVARLQSSNLSNDLETTTAKHLVVPDLNIDEYQTKLQSELAELTLKLGDAHDKVRTLKLPRAGVP